MNKLQQRTINDILAFHNEGHPLNYTYVKSFKSNYISRARRDFGSWENALTACGFDYDSIKFTGDDIMQAGADFEKLLHRILLETGAEIVPCTHDKLQPDFVLKNGTWVDAKLSQNGHSRSQQLPKYADVSRQVIAVYLRGNKDMNMKLPRGYILRSVYFYIKQLPLHRQRYYQNEIDKILAGV